MTDAPSRTPDCLDDATVVAFLEGDLSEAERVRVDAHVDGCSSCLALVAAMGRGEPDETLADPERYELGEEIGVGGMGQVFRAFDTVLGREVALKCVRGGPDDAAAAQRFEREMSLTARLQHPSIIPVYDAGFFPDGSHYFAMRLVEGQTLDDAIEQASTLEGRLELIPSVRRACEAVAFAHQKSVIHRDLKPANILAGPFGETVVLDWGLGKRLDEDDAVGESVSDAHAGQDGMTRPGAVMGTPGYIAPEVRDGQSAEPSADVYSLGRILRKLVTGVADEGRTELLADLRAIIARATADDPRLRYLDAEQLCDDLRRFEAGQRVGARDYTLRSRTRRFARRHRSAIVLSLGFVVVGIVAGVGVTAWLRADVAAPCMGAQQALAEVWDEARRAQVEGAITAVERPFAPAAWTRAEAELDDYADAWVAMHTEACEATALGTQSSALLDLRMACLARAAQRFGATVEVLADADVEVVEKVDGLIDGLQPVSQCADLEALQADVLPPAPELAEAVDRARASLTRADVRRDAARLEEAQQAMEQAEATLEGVDYEPVLTELALSRGKLAWAQGDNAAADVAFSEVIRRGAALGQWDEVRDALTWGMLVLGNRLMKPQEALRYRELAEGLSKGDGHAEGTFQYHLATVLHTAGDAEGAEAAARESLAIRKRRGDALGVSAARSLLGGIFMEQGKPAEAERELRAAVSVRTQRMGAQHPVVANTRTALAGALVAQGELAEAEVEARAALEISRAALAPGHEVIAAAHVTLGNILAGRGTDAEAEAQYRAALEIFEATVGPDHPRVAMVRNNLGNLLWARGKGAEAEETFRRAFAVFEKRLGPDHPSTVTVRVGIGNALHLQGKLDEAEQEMRLVLEKRAESLGPEHPKLGLAHTNLAGVLVSAGRFAEAEREFRTGLEIMGVSAEPGDADIVRVRTELADLLRRRGRLQEGLELAELAWAASREKEDFPALGRARAAFALAQLLWEHDAGQRPRARDLARDALTSCESCFELPEQIEAWLASHPAP